METKKNREFIGGDTSTKDLPFGVIFHVRATVEWPRKE